MNLKQKLVFIQLPIPRLTITLEDHNLPVAAYYLAAYLQEQEIGQYFDVQFLDPFIQNYGSDDTILQEILRIAPDVVGFSLFCWNIERSLYLAEQIKTRSPVSPFILAGGPEVTPDNMLLHQSAVDLYVSGEGEYTLHTILTFWLTNHNIPLHLPGTMYLRDETLYVNPPQRHAVDINATGSAYLKGIVPTYWNQMFFETMRGCPYTCHFCYYNKNCGDLRFLKQEKVLDLLQYALDHDYSEVFLLDPSFNIRPDLEELLIKMAKVNMARQVKIATELRADMIDAQLAQLLADAGIYEVEIGLQSIHPDTIRQIGRTQDVNKFLRGTHAMLERGIETKVDLIVGLPGDDLEKFKASARWVKKNGLDGYLQVFCLSVLPGTYFRKHADEFGLTYLLFPPYYLTSSSAWSTSDIRDAFSWAEDYFGITFDPDFDEEFTLSPVLSQSQSGTPSYKESALQEILQLDPRRPFELPPATTGVTKWLIDPIRSAQDLWAHLNTIQTYTQKNPYGIYHVYLQLHHEVPIQAFIEFYTAFKPLKRQFIDRDFSVLSLDESPIFHYRMEILIAKPLLSAFSESYLETLRQHFHLEVVA